MADNELKDHLESLLRKQFREVLEDTWREGQLSYWKALPGPEWWVTVRDGIIAPVLREAVAALSHSGLYASSAPNNSTGIRLETGSSKHPPHSNLIFAFDPTEDLIRVTSSRATSCAPGMIGASLARRPWFPRSGSSSKGWPRGTPSLDSMAAPSGKTSRPH